MPLGTRAKITIAAGLTCAMLFLVLGMRELSRAGEPGAQASIPVAISSVVTSAAPVLSLAAATRAINAGETITADMIRNAPGDPASFPSAATAAEAIGKVATMPIPAGAVVVRSALGTENKLAIRVPVGMRAISIDTTAEIAVAGLVRPGDRVDVQVVYPGEDALSGARGNARSRAQTLLQMVQVLAVGEVVLGGPTPGATDGALSSPPPPARNVTLALNPAQVSTLSLAKSTGALYLSLRNPTDQQLADVGPVSSVPAAAAPRASSAPVRAAARPAGPRHAIELVVGDRRETIYSAERAQ